MKAMLLAAGRGSRMKSMTDDAPKPLVHVAGKAMMMYAVENLKRAGVSDLVINTHYKADLIQSFVEECGSFDLAVSISAEDELLDTGGGILKARRYLENTDHFVVHNADVYSEIDLKAMVATHIDSGADVTLAVKKRDTSRGLLFSEDLQLLGWENKETAAKRLAEGVDESQPYSSYGFCGIHVISSRVFDNFAAMGEERFSIIEAYLRGLNSGLDIRGFDIGETTWFDIGTPEKLATVEEYLASR